MNKYVLILHDQYYSFKEFLAENRELKLKESQEKTVNQVKTDNVNVDSQKIRTDGDANRQSHRIKITYNSDKSQEVLAPNNQKTTESTRSNAVSYSSTTVKPKNPIPPPGSCKVGEK